MTLFNFTVENIVFVKGIHVCRGSPRSQLKNQVTKMHRIAVLYCSNMTLKFSLLAHFPVV